VSDNRITDSSLLTDDDGRTRIWVLIVGVLLYLWSFAIYAYIFIAAPSFKELFSGFGADLPSLTAIFLKYAWLSTFLALASLIPLIALWRNRALTNVGKGRDFGRVVIAFLVSILFGSIGVYAFYLPIFKLGAVVS